MRWQTLKELHQSVSGDGSGTAADEPNWHPIDGSSEHDAAPPTVDVPANKHVPPDQDGQVGIPDALKRSLGLDISMEAPEEAHPQEVRSGDSQDAGERREAVSECEDILPELESSQTHETSFSALDVRDRVVIMLLFKQIVQMQEVEAAWKRWQDRSGGTTREPLWRVLARDPAFDRDRILEEAAKTAGYRPIHFDPAEAAPFMEAEMERFGPMQRDRLMALRVLPIAREEHRSTGKSQLVFVTPDPSRPDVSRLVRELKLPAFEIRYGSEKLVARLLADLGGAVQKASVAGEEDGRVATSVEPPAVSTEAAQKLLPSSDGRTSEIEASTDGQSLPGSAGRTAEVATSVVPEPHATDADRTSDDVLDRCLAEAVRRGATDIHIYPSAGTIIVDMRIGGRLQRWDAAEGERAGTDLLAIAKKAAVNIDPSERDSAQDGSVKRIVDGAPRHFRVSVLPIAGTGPERRQESVVIRLVDDERESKELREIGFGGTILDGLQKAVRRPSGMIVLAGPSGSGKTATTHGLIAELVERGLNVVTLEESVEYESRGVRQVRLNERLDNAEALEAVRRHDADAVLVGHLRTKQAAELALKLANAEHLVLSRVSAYDSAGVVGRLLRWGIEPVLVAYAISLIVAQRTVRALCPDCKQPARHVDGEMLRTLGFSPNEIATSAFFEESAAHAGENEHICGTCTGSGYAGSRIAAEALPFSNEVRRLIALADSSFDDDDLREVAVQEGMTTLRASAREIVREGATTISELIRATAGEH